MVSQFKIFQALHAHSNGLTFDELCAVLNIPGSEQNDLYHRLMHWHGRRLLNSSFRKHVEDGKDPTFYFLSDGGKNELADMETHAAEKNSERRKDWLRWIIATGIAIAALVVSIIALYRTQ